MAGGPAAQTSAASEKPVAVDHLVSASGPGGCQAGALFCPYNLRGTWDTVSASGPGVCFLLPAFARPWLGFRAQRHFLKEGGCMKEQRCNSPQRALGAQGGPLGGNLWSPGGPWGAPFG